MDRLWLASTNMDCTKRQPPRDFDTALLSSEAPKPGRVLESLKEGVLINEQGVQVSS